MFHLLEAFDLSTKHYLRGLVSKRMQIDHFYGDLFSYFNKKIPVISFNPLYTVEEYPLPILSDSKKV